MYLKHLSTHGFNFYIRILEKSPMECKIMDEFRTILPWQYILWRLLLLFKTTSKAYEMR